MAKLIDLTGKRFGKLTVIKRGEDKFSPRGDKKITWVCKCDCGKEITVCGTNLKTGNTQSCGCKNKGILLHNLTGEKFGRLTVVERAENKNGKTAWKCLCDCGNEVVVNASDIKQGRTQSCGCYRKDKHKEYTERKTKNITGEKFGKLTAIKPIGSKNGKIWECRCDCGNTTNVSLGNLINGHIRSCGCLNKGIIRNFKHGYGHERIYHEYIAMITRCKKDYKNHVNYYDRGIRVCPEWLGKHGLSNFVEWAMGNGYADNLTIDRIDNDKGYSPDNCRWTTAKVQANNRRNNIVIEYKGEKKTLKEWCEELNLPYKTIYNRIKVLNWNITRTFEEPINK